MGKLTLKAVALLSLVSSLLCSPCKVCCSRGQLFRQLSSDRSHRSVTTPRCWSILSPPLSSPPLCADMEKFPLRMKDNDLLVTELFQDPSHDPITSLSVYLTPALCEDLN